MKTLKVMLHISKKESRNDFDRLYWLTSIKKSKDDFRAHVRYVYSDGLVLVNTDGSRLHVIVPETFDLEAGFYEVVKRNKSEIALSMALKSDEAEFPDWESIFNDSGRLARFWHVRSFDYDPPMNVAHAVSHLVRFIADHEDKDERFCFNVGYIEDALSSEYGMQHIQYRGIKAGDPLYFTDNINNPNLLAAVMPMYDRE